jgi:hypothetical protein
MRLLTRRSQARSERAVAGQMHLVAAELAAHVRAGRTLAQAIGDVAEDMPEPARSELAVAAAAIRLGMPPTEALARLRGGTDASVLASAANWQPSSTAWRRRWSSEMPSAGRPRWRRRRRGRQRGWWLRCRWRRCWVWR